MKDLGLLSSILVTIVLLLILIPFGSSLLHVSLHPDSVENKTKAEIEHYHQIQMASNISPVGEESESLHAAVNYVTGVAHGSMWLKIIPVRIACYPKIASVCLLALIVFVGCWIALVLLPPPSLAGSSTFKNGTSQIEWTSTLDVLRSDSSEP
ncbi:hypothetical protein EI77_03616 [Prosthecobacter fusiformis]|uniref:Uncharacterized protein n=1 Tax=Prosthecobacter fusiformis TaxID=48464 RepID=A0A4R7RMB6_9BACT|nr:hypothetical protein [Prosthecobacter fusiformis]TDU66521.1 hypothetical protein EI77_03616 [Prosthecobacter fusiformis]